MSDDDNTKYVQAADVDDPKKVKITETLIKLGVAVPLMLVLGNHLGGFLPLTFATETNTANHKRYLSLVLIFLLLIVSLAGSIDWSLWSSKIPAAAYPAMDILASLFAFGFLLMTLRFTHQWMYTGLAALVVGTILMFYGAKASITTKVTDDGKEEKVMGKDADKWVTSAQVFVGVTAVYIIAMYFLSVRFINANYSDLFETSGRFYTIDPNTKELETFNVSLTPEVGFLDYMAHPQPVKDAAKFREIVKTRPLWKNGGKIFTGKRGSHGQTVNLEPVSGLSAQMSDQNDAANASKDYIMSIEQIPNPSALWKNENREFVTNLTSEARADARAPRAAARANLAADAARTAALVRDVAADRAAAAVPADPTARDAADRAAATARAVAEQAAAAARVAAVAARDAAARTARTGP